MGVLKKKRVKNGHLFGFILRTYIYLFDPFTNIFILFRNTILY